VALTHLLTSFFVLLFIAPNPTRLRSDVAALSVALLESCKQYLDIFVFIPAMRDAPIILRKTERKKEKKRKDSGSRQGRGYTAVAKDLYFKYIAVI
jgi:hypothetical protein